MFTVKCKVPNCNGEVVARGLCNKHYIRETRGSKPPKHERLRNVFLDDSEECAYLLGLLYGDGCIRYYANPSKHPEVSLYMVDEDVIRQASVIIGLPGEYTKTYKGRKQVLFGLSFTSREVVATLKRRGLDEEKGTIQKTPVIVEENQRHFLRGLVDSDGSISKDQRVEIYTSGTELKDWIGRVLESQGIQYSQVLSYQSDNEKIKIWKTSIKTQFGNSIRFCEWLYKDAKYYGERKYNRFVEMKTSRAQSNLTKNRDGLGKPVNAGQVCKNSGCHNPAVCRGLCDKHYTQWKRARRNGNSES